MKPVEPVIRNVPDSDLIELMETYTTSKLIILEGFKYNGASIPRLLWFLTGHPLSAQNLPGATEHDADYAAQYFSRKEADHRLRDAWIHAGKNKYLAYLMWAFVRLVGWIIWIQVTPEQIRKARQYIILNERNSSHA